MDVLEAGEEGVVLGEQVGHVGVGDRLGLHPRPRAQLRRAPDERDELEIFVIEFSILFHQTWKSSRFQTPMDPAGSILYSCWSSLERCNVQCAMCNVQCAMCNVQCAMCNVQCGG